jgi:hypothetical protein
MSTHAALACKNYIRFTRNHDGSAIASADVRPFCRVIHVGITVALRTRMEVTHQAIAAADNRWERLQELLTGLRPGQTVTIDGISTRTGLGSEAVNTVLQALTRAELFAQVDQTTFVRDSLLKF